MAEGLAVGLAWFDGLLGTNGATDGPDVDGVVAGVLDHCVAHGGCQGGQGQEGEGLELHFVLDWVK